MRKLNSQFITTFVSETGLDGQNGTYYGFVEMDRYYCMAVAEGYDGDGGFESAKLAVDAAMEAFVQKPGMSAGRIRACLKKAHRCLKEHPAEGRNSAVCFRLYQVPLRCLRQCNAVCISERRRLPSKCYPYGLPGYGVQKADNG